MRDAYVNSHLTLRLKWSQVHPLGDFLHFYTSLHKLTLVNCEKHKFTSFDIKGHQAIHKMAAITLFNIIFKVRLVYDVLHTVEWLQRVVIPLTTNIFKHFKVRLPFVHYEYVNIVNIVNIACSHASCTRTHCWRWHSYSSLFIIRFVAW